MNSSRDARYRRDFPLPSREEIRLYSRLHRETPQDARVRLIYALQENRYSPVARLAKKAGVAERTVRRWLLSLRTDGYRLFLDGRRRGRRLSTTEVTELRSRLVGAAFGSVEEARLWVARRFGVTYTNAGMASLLEREFPDLSRRILLLRRDSQLGRRRAVVSRPNVDRIVDFLCRIPRTLDFDRFVDEMKAALRILAPSALGVFVHYLGTASLEPVPTGKAGVVYLFDQTEARSVAPSSIGEQESAVDESLRASLVSSGRLDPDSHRLISYPCLDEVGNRLGTILMVFRADDSHIEQVEELFDLLAPFLVTCIHSILVRFRQATPMSDPVTYAIGSMMRRAALTAKEREVYGLHMLGLSRKEIAEDLSKTISTVDDQIASIHRKFDVKSRGDMMALLLTHVIDQTDVSREEAQKKIIEVLTG